MQLTAKDICYNIQYVITLHGTIHELQIIYFTLLPIKQISKNIQMYKNILRKFLKKNILCSNYADYIFLMIKFLKT